MKFHDVPDLDRSTRRQDHTKDLAHALAATSAVLEATVQHGDEVRERCRETIVAKDKVIMEFGDVIRSAKRDLALFASDLERPGSGRQERVKAVAAELRRLYAVLDMALTPENERAL